MILRILARHHRKLLAVTVAATAAGAVAAPLCGAAKRPWPTKATTTTTTTTAPAQLFGFNDAGAIRRGQITAAKSAELGQTAGANTVRITFDWRNAEPWPGGYDLADYDAIYNQAIARGSKPIFGIMFAPKWAQDPNDCTSDCKYPPSTNVEAGWKRLFTTLAARYPRTAAFEVWNEPNLNFFWQSGPDPVRYAWMVRTAKEALTAAGSQIPVLAGAVATYAGNSNGNMDSADFLAGVYAEGVKDSIDGLSFHPYPQDVDDAEFTRELVQAREVRDAAGDDAKLWVTEYGMSTATTKFTEAQQAAQLTRLRSKLAAMPDVRGQIVHVMVDVTKYATTDPEYGYGFLRGDLTPKPAWCALSDAAAQTAGCPSAVNLSLGAAQDARWQAQDVLETAIEAARTARNRLGSAALVNLAALRLTAPALSTTAQVMTALPGATADPTRIFLFTDPLKPKTLEVCNVSTADRAYCALTIDGRHWRFGSAVGSIAQAAGAAFANTGRGSW